MGAEVLDIVRKHLGVLGNKPRRELSLCNPALNLTGSGVLTRATRQSPNPRTYTPSLSPPALTV
jgi:hypothetical protein